MAVSWWYAPIALAVLAVMWLVARVRPSWRGGLIVADMVVCLVYIGWRVTTIPFRAGPVSATLGVLLFAAEMLGMVAFFDFQYLFLGKRRQLSGDIRAYGDNLPFVDVLICTYNEPLRVLEMTMAAAVQLDYPTDRFKVHVCDDGNRKELGELCASYGVDWITREGNEGAKAGNINHALEMIDGELFAVLDADMVPKREFLQRTVGYFADERMAFVQTPQTYYNPDMYQYNLSRRDIPNEQDFFMRDIQQARADRNAVLHVGTNAVFRKRDVLAVGGYPTCSITEDMAVGMLLQAHGYASAFVNEELVCGLSVMTFSDMVKQRDRWCRGNLQVLRHFNPLFTKGLSRSQKIAYLDGAVYWFSNFQKMIYLLCPLIHLLTHTVILECTFAALMTVYIPFMVGQYAIFHVLSPRTRTIRWSHYYEIAMAPHLCVSILKELFHVRTSFAVTAKDTVLDRASFQMSVALPHMVLALLTVAAWAVSAVSFAMHYGYAGSMLLSLVWSVYNVTGIIVAIMVAYQRPIVRSSERVAVLDTVPVSVQEAGGVDGVGGTVGVETRGADGRCRCDGEVVDISGTGMGVRLGGRLDERAGQDDGADETREWLRRDASVTVILDGVALPATVARVADRQVGVRFGALDPAGMRAVMRVFAEHMHSYREAVDAARRA